LERQAAQPRIEDGVAYLPFDLTEVSNELRQEAYVNGNERRMMSAVNAAYYLVRPILPVAVRNICKRSGCATGNACGFRIGRWIARWTI